VRVEAFQDTSAARHFDLPGGKLEPLGPGSRWVGVNVIRTVVNGRNAQARGRLTTRPLLPYTAMADAIFTHPLLAEGLNTLFAVFGA
jgi:hypothetical protein